MYWMSDVYEKVINGIVIIVNVIMVFKKRCWYRIGSPPPAVSKKDVLKLRSVSTIVIAICIGLLNKVP